MLYPFMTLPDETEIVHSEILLKNNKENVKVYIERPIDGGFASQNDGRPWRIGKAV